MTGMAVSSYRGFRLLITERDVTVLDRRGRTRLGRVSSVSAARRFVKGYERAEREERRTL